MVTRPPLGADHAVAAECEGLQAGAGPGHQAHIHLAAVAAVAEEPELREVRAHRLQHRHDVGQLDTAWREIRSKQENIISFSSDSIMTNMTCNNFVQNRHPL